MCIQARLQDIRTLIAFHNFLQFQCSNYNMLKIEIRFFANRTIQKQLLLFAHYNLKLSYLAELPKIALVFSDNMEAAGRFLVDVVPMARKCHTQPMDQI